eukprot:TRINITY_DN3695_c0_g2_i4.p1 TRINITY_DN3695_c0_g2~~TRINITY_DN3695_c0_g2_i4.p1  ORF type:complete len:103 (-),score=13.95 TRINITY_DN3695_c0_g2_i4:93-401(-)
MISDSSGGSGREGARLSVVGMCSSEQSPYGTVRLERLLRSGSSDGVMVLGQSVPAYGDNHDVEVVGVEAVSLKKKKRKNRKKKDGNSPVGSPTHRDAEKEDD